MAIIIYLIWTALSILLTINVFTPFANQSKSSLKTVISSFILGWMVGDLLPQWLILNFGILLIFSFSDILISSLGLFGLICHLFCWIILSIRLWIIINLPERINLKMIDYFGTTWQKIASNNYSPKNILDIDWQSWLNPTKSLEDPRIEILRDQIFHDVNGLQLKLDIYRPINIKERSPGILQIHGGGWITGSKRQASSFLVRMASQGWVCYSITHRFSPKVVFPEHLIDVKRALKWIRTNADEHGLDKNFIIAKGGSSGAHLASLMALTQNQSEFQPGFEKIDTSIQGCVPLYGVFDFIGSFDEKTPFPAKSKLLKKVCGGIPKKKPNCYKKITPANWISMDTPPFFILQGETDSLISVEEPKIFWENLKSNKISSSAFLSLPLVQHGFDIFPTLTEQYIIPIVEQFFKMLHHNYKNQKRKNETYGNNNSKYSF